MQVLYEDNHIIVVNKPVAELVQGDRTGDVTLSDKVKLYVKKKYKKPGDVYLGIPHRLDRPTSGIVIFARTSKALERLTKMFAERQIQKTYWAVIQTRPRELEETLENYLVKNEEKNRSHIAQSDKKGGKFAKLSYRYLCETARNFMLEIDLHTGRHHQIRAQLGYVGCHIKGDLKYGSKNANKDSGIHLHARKVSFIHPVKKERIEIIAPVPQKDNLWVELEKIANAL